MNRGPTPGTCDHYCDPCAAYLIFKQAGTLLNKLLNFSVTLKTKNCYLFFDVLVTLTLQILQNTRTLGTLGHCLSIVYVFGVALHYLYVIKIPEQPLSDKLPEGRSEAPNFGFTWPMICAFSSPQDLANGDWSLHCFSGSQGVA